MPPFGLLLDRANAADVRGIAEEASNGLLVEELTGVVTLIASSFTATAIDDQTSGEIYRAKANNAAERVVIGVDDALERMRRRRCR